MPLRSILAFTPGRGAARVGEMPRPLRYAAVAAVGGDRADRRRDVRHDGASGRSCASTRRPGRVARIGRFPRRSRTPPARRSAGGSTCSAGAATGLDTQRATIWAIDPAPAAGHAAPAGCRRRSPTWAPRRWAAGSSSLGGRDAAGGVHDEVLDADAPGHERAPADRRRAGRGLLAGCGGGWLAGHATTRRDHRCDAAAQPPRDAAGARGPAACRRSSPRRRLRRRRRAAGSRPVVRGDPARVYVPNSESEHRRRHLAAHRARIVDHFAVGALPQHVTPSWDLRTLWVTNDLGNSLTPIDPRTGRHGRPVPVADPYNLYFTADGRRAIVVAEAHRELDFRSPHTMRLRHALPTPQCPGVDHMDYTADGRRALVSCEFGGRMIVVDLRARARPADDRAARRARCRRTSSSRPTGARSTSPTWRPAASG